jgi:hypothetical protein
VPNPNEAVSNTPPFTLSLVRPFSTFVNGKPKPIPYIVDGLLPSGSWSTLSAKPKQGKTSLSRYLSVCIAKGLPFLGRDTQRGEVLLLSLEDPLQHVDICLGALGYDPRHDCRIHIATKLSPRIEESIAAIEDTVSANKDIRLIVVDTLPKLLRSDDLNDYSKTLPNAEKISGLARRNPHLHLMCIGHSKKAKTDDPHDSSIGTTLLRGEPDTTIALHEEKGHRLITAQTRVGRSIPDTILLATEVESAGAHVVSSFSLDVKFADWKRDFEAEVETARKISHEDRIVSYLKERHDGSAPYSEVLKAVEGRTELNQGAIKSLVEKGILTVTGKKQSRTDPQILHLNENATEVLLNRCVGASGGELDAA